LVGVSSRIDGRSGGINLWLQYLHNRFKLQIIIVCKIVRGADVYVFYL